MVCITYMQVKHSYTERNTFKKILRVKEEESTQCALMILILPPTAGKTAHRSQWVNSTWEKYPPSFYKDIRKNLSQVLSKFLCLTTLF